jgi:hypothetical protein
LPRSIARARSATSGWTGPLVARGVNLWIKDPAEEKAFLEALKAAKKDDPVKVEATTHSWEQNTNFYAPPVK